MVPHVQVEAVESAPPPPPEEPIPDGSDDDLDVDADVDDDDTPPTDASCLPAPTELLTTTEPTSADGTAASEGDVDVEAAVDTVPAATDAPAEADAGADTATTATAEVISEPVANTADVVPSSPEEDLYNAAPPRVSVRDCHCVYTALALHRIHPSPCVASTPTLVHPYPYHFMVSCPTTLQQPACTSWNLY